MKYLNYLFNYLVSSYKYCILQTDIMYVKSWIKYLFLFIILLIGSAVLFAPVNLVSLNNETFFSTPIGFKVQDWSVFVAFAVGLGSIVLSIFTTEKSHNSLKFSSIPEKSVNLLIDLEFLFTEHENGDKLILLTEILKYWKDHQKAFRLLTPNFYKNFLKIISNNEKINNEDSISNVNSKYVICAIKAQISDVAFENEETLFSFIKPNLITDGEDIKIVGESLENYVNFDIEKTNFEDYINNFNGKETQDKTFKKFNKFYCDVEGLLKDLKKEIEEYD